MTTTATPPALLNLSNLSERIDIQGFYERQGVAIHGKVTISRRDGKEWHGSCPECGGEDRFAFWESGRFSCSLRSSGCGIHGSSPYWFLRDVKGYSHSQALEELGIDQEEIADSYSQRGNKLPLPLFLLSDEPPCAKWQEAAYTFCHVAERCLWGPKGETARAYLQNKRGFTEATIKSAHLGFCPGWYNAPLEDWGLSPEQLMKTDDPQIKVPRGIVIPWFVGSSIHKIQLRRDTGGYFEILGSSECIYSLSPIEDRPVLLVESEFDALSAHQEASDLICCVATGGTPKGRNARNLTQLHQASTILQAFDDDPAGHKAAEEWQQLIPSIIRHTPWSHDVNDMLREDMPVRAWIELGLSNCEPEPVELPALDINGREVPPELIERVALFQRAPCMGCGGNDWFIDHDGRLTCPCVKALREEGRLIDLRLTQETQRNRSPVSVMDW